MINSLSRKEICCLCLETWHMPAHDLFPDGRPFAMQMPPVTEVPTPGDENSEEEVSRNGAMWLFVKTVS